MNPAPQGINCLQVVRDASHFELLEAVYKTFIKREGSDNKRYAVWFHGPTSAGKSKFIERLMEIFVCQKSDFVRGHLISRAKQEHKRKFKTQIVCIPEFNIDVALEGATFPDVLQLFEGAGAPIKPNLYRGYAETSEETFEKTFFLMASNRLP